MKNLLTTCCLLAATLFSINGFAGDGDKKGEKKNTPYTATTTNAVQCTNCAWAGDRKSVTGCGSVVIGPSTTCSTSGPNAWICPGATACCLTSPTYSWAPSTGLSCTNCMNPTFTNCDPNSGSRTYTFTVGGCTPCNPGVSTVVVSWTGCCAGCCRIGHFDNPQQNVEPTGISVYPNPSSGILILELDAVSQKTTTEVYGVDGKLVIRKNNLLVGKNEIDLSGNAKGVYYIQVLEDGKGIFNKKILVE